MAIMAGVRVAASGPLNKHYTSSQLGFSLVDEGGHLISKSAT